MLIHWAHVGPSLLASFLAPLVECVEALTMVLAVGATRGWRSAMTGSAAGLLVPAIVGAIAALVVVVALGAIVQRPLARVPENTLEFVVGMLLCAFGTSRAGEGMAHAWPYGDVTILGLMLGWLLAALLAVRLCRQQLVVAKPQEST